MWWGLMFTLSVLTGCGRAPDNIAPVEGQVLFNGLPARASLTAQLVDDKGQPQGRPSTADTRIDGTFSLGYTEQQAGALIGTHKVQISVFPLEREAGEFDFQQRFRPVKVARFTRKVESGDSNHWNFVLKY